MNNKVLLFAYDYPPRGWSGVQRTVKFVRYMPHYGWDPIIVTTSDWYSEIPLDYSFCDEVAHAVTIRTRAFTRKDWSRLAHFFWIGMKPVLAPMGKDKKWLEEGLRWRLEKLFFPDEGVVWLPYAVREGLAAVRKHKPSVVYATAPPYSTLISAWIVAKISRLPLVVDLRDLWVDNPVRATNGRIKKRIDGMLEHIVLSGADAVLTTTRSGVDLLRSKYQRRRHNIFTIYNGYDDNDFALYKQNVNFRNDNALIIRHIGSLYSDRSPTPFLNGLSEFMNLNNEVTLDIAVHFVGKVEEFASTFKEYEGLGVVKTYDQVEHPTAIEMMCTSDVLLLIVPDGNQRVIYGKVFEYLASGRPILAIIPLDSEVADLLHQAGNTWVVDVGDVKGIVLCLNEIYEKWSTGQSLGYTNQEYVSMFERKHLTRQLCDMFESLVGTSGASIQDG